MAKLKATPEFISRAVFDDEPVEIVGAEFVDGLVILEIKGPFIPDVDAVSCEVSIARRTFTFKEA